MDSTNTPFRNAEPPRTTESPHNFVLGSRFQTTSSNNPQYTRCAASASYQQIKNDNYDVDLLKDLSIDFSGLLNRTDISDCWLNVRGTFMAVHRCVLAARSDVFSAVMSGNISRLDPDTQKELITPPKDDKCVLTIGKTDPETMKRVIIFMYTAKCDLNERNAYNLLEAAWRYHIRSLKTYTTQFLVNHINTNNVLKLIESAHQYKNQLLQERCTEYFIDNGKAIIDVSESWKPFVDKHPKIVAELLYWTTHKEEYRQETS